MTSTMPARTPTQVTRWLRDRIAGMVPVPVEQITSRTTFADLGLSSAQGIELVDDLEHWLGSELSPTLVYDYPTIGLAVRAICAEQVMTP